MRLTISLSLLLLLAGCDGFPVIMPQERCGTVLDTENPMIVNDEVYYKGACQCQLYEWNQQHIGKIGAPITRPLLYCDKFIGFSPASTGTIYSWQESIRLWLIRHEKKGSTDAPSF